MEGTPKGMRDILPDDMMVREKVRERIIRFYRTYGYRPLDTPAMEYLETLKAKAGEEVSKQIFVLEGERLGLRFDLTVPLARVSATNEFPRPFKRYHIANVWRREEPQKGRFREFLQADVDIIGSESMRCEAEVLTLAMDLCESFGFKKPRILLNNRKILDALAKKIGFDEQKDEVFRILDKMDKIGKKDTEKMLREVLGKKADELLKYIKTSGTNKQKLDAVRKVEDQGVKELEEILALCNFDIEIDLALVRGLGYYTGPIFEIKLSDDIGSVMAGGRYDNLLSVYGQPGPATGISIGIERLITLIKERENGVGKKTYTRVFVACAKPEFYKDTLAVAAELRRNGIAAETDIKERNLRKQFDYANSLGIQYTAIIGAREKESGTVTLRDMVSGNEEILEISDAIKRLNTNK